MKAPPKWLSDIALEYWDEYVKHVNDSTDNYHTLAQLCRWWELFREAEKQLDREGLTIIGTSGQPRQHPSISTMNTAQVQITRIKKQLELDRVAAKPKGASELTKILKMAG